MSLDLEKFEETLPPLPLLSPCRYKVLLQWVVVCEHLSIFAQLTVRPYAMPAMYRFLAHFSLTCEEGNALVLRVSCVSSVGRRRGTLSRNALWSGVAAQAVIRKPASHLSDASVEQNQFQHSHDIAC